MTAARRALPPRPTALQRLGARLTAAGRNDALVSALEDHTDRLDARARRAGGERSTLGIELHLAADEVRQILQEHQP